MRNFSFILALLAAGASVTAVAESLEDKVRACAALQGESERLACYDRAAAVLMPGGEPRATQAPPAEATRAETPRAAELPQGRERNARATPAAIAAKVTALHESSTDGLVIELDNGERWRTIPEDARLLLKAGDTVTISRGVLGSYRLATPSGRVARVNRLR